MAQERLTNKTTVIRLGHSEAVKHKELERENVEVEENEIYLHVCLIFEYM